MKEIFQKPIYSHVSNEEQVMAAFSFTKKTLLLTQKDYQESFANWAIEKIENSDDSDFALKVAIAAFDYCISDEMRPYVGNLPAWTDNSAVYYRYEAYRAWYPPEVLESVFSVSNTRGDIIIGTKDQITRQKFPPEGQGMLTPEVAFWVDNFTTHKKPEPTCSIPRQVLYKSLLKCGIDPLSTVDQVEIRKTHSRESRYKKKYRLKSLRYMEANEEKVKGWEKNSVAHWERILNQERGNLNSDTLLFNSGTAANEAVIRTLFHLTAGNVYRHPFWYFENERSVSKLFSSRLITNPEDADIIFLNLEPVNYFSLGKPDPDKSPHEIIKRFVEKVEEQKQKSFFLVVDATVDPMFSIEGLTNRVIPPNLKFIKTASVTKHQDGGRNYFFGASLIINGKEIVEDLRLQRSMNGEDLFEEQSVHFPRPSTKLIEIRRQKIAHINKSLSLLNADDKGWKIVPYTYHSYIYPPNSFINKVHKYCAGLPEEVKNRRMNELNEFMLGLVCSGIESSNTSTVEIGDSFGLPQTRVNVVGGPTMIDGTTFLLKIPRLCPGYDTSLEDLAECYQEIAKVLKKGEQVMLKAFMD